MSLMQCQIFIIPKLCAPHRTDGIYRAFLRSGNYLSSESCPIAWSTICQPKEGNTAAVTKHVWAIANKKDNLWIEIGALTRLRWMIYQKKIKNKRLRWVWKSVCQMYQGIAQGGSKVDWHRVVWNRFSVPKHRFMLWLCLWSRMPARDRLVRFRICSDNSCLLCIRGKRLVPFVYQCPFSSSCPFTFKMS
ncbi:hypothetical protein RDABS01_014680 [Bienertia sinuspersici]